MQARQVTVTAFPRLHVGLVDLGNTTFRRYGGGGFTLTGPVTEVIATHSSRDSVEAVATVDARTLSDLRQALTRFRQHCGVNPVKIRITASSPQHVGFGSKTAIILAALQATQSVYQTRLTNKELQQLSGRGGTSGVGINSFFSGGFLIDAGQPRSNDEFRPSRAQRPEHPPGVVCRISIPKSWHFHPILMTGPSVHGKKERTFFRKNTPIPRAEVLNVIALMYQGLAPALIDRDLPLLVEVIRRLQTTGFKRREVRNQTEDVRVVMKTLARLPRCAVGISSLGPLIYAITDGQPDTCQEIERIAVDHKAVSFGCQRGRNSGFETLIRFGDEDE